MFRFHTCTLLVVLSACSLVNSTDDLRNMDSGGVDATAFDAGPEVDAGPEADAGPGDARPPDSEPDPVDAGPECPPATISSIETFQATYPPLLTMSFVEASSCDEELSFTVSSDEESVDYEFTLSVPGGTREITFAYLGPRVPFFDEGERMREFNPNNGTAPVNLRMPVEQLVVFDELMGLVSATAVETGAAHVDIANDGTVAFGSSSNELGVQRPTAFVWVPSPRTIEVTEEDGTAFTVIVSNIELHALNDPLTSVSGPVIDDNARALAFYNDSTGKVFVKVRESEAAEVVTRFAPSASRRLDLRSYGPYLEQQYLLLIPQGNSVDGNVLYANSNDGGQFLETSQPGFNNGGPGTIMMGPFSSPEAPPARFGYAALASIPTGYLSDGSSVTDTSSCTPEANSLVHVHLREDGAGFAYRCSTGMLAVDGTLYRVNDEISGEAWAFLGANDDHEVFLMRAEPDNDTGSPYVLGRLEDEMYSDEVVSLDGFGNALTGVLLADTLTGAAISPNGEWLVYSAFDGTEMRVFRIPVDDEIASEVLPPASE